ncbi:MAG: serine protease [Polyangiaceae bacterium]
MSSRIVRFLTVLLLSVFAPSAFAQAVAYDNIDQATVRVLGMGNIEVEAIEDAGQTYQLAVPIAGHGSGVLLSKDGLILTAAHVIADARALAVLVPGRLGPLPAVTVYTDTTRDFALLRVKGDFEHIAELADPKAPLAIRQDVFAIGYPLDATRMDPQSTPGIVSGVRPTGELQLGMSVNPGNSGGPVVDSEGKVRGIVVSRSRLDEGAVGLAYAVPLQTFVETAKSYVGKSPDATQQAYLNADTSRRLADLTSLMSLYGLEVMKTSLSKSEMEVDPRIKGALDEASQGANASTDGRLLSAVFYWNQSLVMRRRGDTNWPTAQAKAVGLVREAAKAEPALQTKSEFVKLLLSLSPAPPVSAPPGQANQDPYGNVNLQPPSDQGPPPPPTESRPRQRARVFLGAGGDLTAISVSTKPAGEFGDTLDFYGQGFGFGFQAGVTVPLSRAWGLLLGGRFSMATLTIDCSCNRENTEWKQTVVGGFFGARWGIGYVGAHLENVEGHDDLATLNAANVGYGLEGGLQYEGERFGVQVSTRFLGADGEDVDYSSLNLGIAALVFF